MASAITVGRERRDPMSMIDADLADHLADLLELGGAESVVWSACGDGALTPVTVVFQELSDALVQEIADTENVRLANVLVPLSIIPNPQRGDALTCPPNSSYAGSWSVLGIEQRGPAHRTVRVRQSQREAARDPAVQRVYR